MGAKLSIDISEDELRQMSDETGFSRSQVIRLCNRFASLAKGKDFLTKADLICIPEVGSNPIGERIVDAFFPIPTDRTPVCEEIDVKQFLRTLACFRPVKANQSSEHKSDNGEAPSHICPNNREAKLRFAFRMYDNDNDGNISRDELLSILSMMVGSNISPDQLASIADRTMVEADTDNDNQISFDEFKEIMAKVDIEQRMSIRFLS